jgi:hypothetical protein
MQEDHQLVDKYDFHHGLSMILPIAPVLAYARDDERDLPSK